ncbi:MAG TPA: hypothetical protein VF299_03080 [Mycobacterium sp.]
MSDLDARVIGRDQREGRFDVPALAWVQLCIGVTATVGVLVTWHRKNTADRRGEWWRRTAWAFERSLSDDRTEATLGWALLKALVSSRLVTTSDLDVAQVVGEHVAIGRFHDDGGRDRAN